MSDYNIERILKKPEWPDAAHQFVEDFISDRCIPKYILGRNIYAESVTQYVSVTGYVDDYTEEQEYLGKPIVKTSEVPKDALVLNAAGGRPLTARERLSSAGINNLDYFAFTAISGLPLRDIRFNEGFEKEFHEHYKMYQWIYNMFEDKISRETFVKLLGFRLHRDIRYLNGFTQREREQYFEKFLNLQENGEIFVDVGAYDGATSLEFIRRYPEYSAIHLYEPDPINMKICKEKLIHHRNVYYYQCGLSDHSGYVGFESSGSSSSINEFGSNLIEVIRLDDSLNDNPTFIKMDVEGSEIPAINGAVNIIGGSHSKLAISVYHRPGDFWQIPQVVLNINSNYKIKLRHYTECIYETVMYFIPR